MLPMLRNRLVAPTLTESTFLEPWSDLRREIDRVFDSLLSGARPVDFDRESRLMPVMDVEETDDLIRLSFEIPGVHPDDVQVSLENGVLTVAGEKKSVRETEGEKKASRVVARRSRRFERALALPQSVNTDDVAARYDNGVLTIELRKSLESRRRKIEISRGGEPRKLESGEKGGRRIA
jgi:HSP20 family protein